ncbi:ATP-dependent protease subunit HslV [Lapidilactobacillus mulanensis]|uniref:ATP-dependent protease subunit HslV n=1 Tax=Lapidilactobacillus mulanensis TaxID=2485999 RepID=A0ABW4DS23_9LACO|nr:ATP-dependent protease subunit HslV [Lapidilactobacillus mulanensis]
MTTIVAVKHQGQIAIAGDGQVTMGEKYIMKASAHKVRRIFDNRVIIGFAGGVADAFTLTDWFEKKLSTYSGDLRRSAVELAQDWRKDPTLQKLEAMLIAFDKQHLLLISGNGEVIEPDENVIAIGSGGNFAQAAAIAMTRHSPDMTAQEIAHEAIEIASSIDIFTNQEIITDQFTD